MMIQIQPHLHAQLTDRKYDQCSSFSSDQRYGLALFAKAILFVGVALSCVLMRDVRATVITVNAGPDIDAANNDYRRIQNAINAAANGDTILLNGTFDFTQPFAAAAWALGNDNTAGTVDDYSVYVPAGLNNVTLTATALGTATIQGPGDLAAVNLEAFLVFDGGPNQNWTISNLRILDFDLSIGMFATPVNAFNNTTIQNNFIRIPTDLNATVAPADVNQNIGIHFSFGTNQSILGNSIQIPGDGVSDTAGGNFSSSVGMQSNVSGGNVYDGLTISNNVIHVLNAQSANPQVVLGIWENGHAHSSNITVSGNSFINDAAGNNPALNIQCAFRVTSHSSAMSAVTYQNNTVSGANIGFQWIAGSNFTGNQAVLLTGNQITNSDTGVLVQSNGIAHFETNAITGSGSGGGIHVITGTLTGSGANPDSVFQTFVSGGSADGIWIEATAGAIAPMAQNDLSGNAGFGLRNQTAPMIIATSNWWGNNLAAPVAAEVSGSTTFDPWLASGTDVNVAAGFQPFVFATTSGTITTFVGTSGADTGSLLAGNPVTMTMNGQTAFTAAAQLLNFDIQLGGGDDVFTLGQTGIPTILDGGTGNDTLVGTNVAQTWNITGAGSGNIPGAATSFTGIEALRGGTAADSFVFGAAGGIALTIDGGLGSDTLDDSAIPGHTITPTGPGTLDGFKGSATGIGSGFDNINLIGGSPADLSITKSAPATVTVGATITYTITVTNGGPNPAINATLTDMLPAGTTFVSLVSAPGWASTTPAVNSAGTVTSTRGSVPAGSSQFTLTVNAPAAPVSVSNTATVTAVSSDPNPGNNSSTVTVNVVAVAVQPAINSATATPNPAFTTQLVQFSALATDPSGFPLTYKWDFKDGSVSTQQNPMHAFAVAGTYAANVTVDNGHGGTASANVSVTILAVTGEGDADGDGFSNEIEIALGSNPFDPNSRPLGLGPIKASGVVTFPDLRIKLDFIQSNADSIALTGHLPVNGVFPMGQVAIVDVGGVVKAFTLNAAGRSRLNSKDSMTLHVRRAQPQLPLSQRNFRLQLSAGYFSKALADEQLTAAAASRAPRTVNVTIIFLNTVYFATVPQLYTVRGSVGRTMTAR